jgi:maltose/moltooligosaccharide transporter
MTEKPRLSLLRIIEMNIGFFGLQFSFGLQQANMGPIYGFLGADEASMPLLWLAGPMTGLIIQPIVGAMSDRTNTRLGRRTPYFLIGAVICTLSLFAMPYSSTLWMAASLLWILDAGNNITMEPYRAYVADRLAPDQRSTGFLTRPIAADGFRRARCARCQWHSGDREDCLRDRRDPVDLHHRVVSVQGAGTAA